MEIVHHSAYSAAVKHLLLVILLVFVLTAIAVPQNRPHGSKNASVSVLHLATSDGERVVSFEFSITSGMVRAISNLPKGWYVTVDNDASWRTHVKGNTLVGAAALSPEEFQQIRLTIEQDETYLKFDLSGTVSVTKNFEKEHPVRLSIKDFAVTAP